MSHTFLWENIPTRPLKDWHPITEVVVQSLPRHCYHDVSDWQMVKCSNGFSGMAVGTRCSHTQQVGVQNG